MKLLLDYNPLAGAREYLHEEGGTIRVVQEQDVNPIMEFTKTLKNDESFSSDMLKAGRALYARIPDNIMLEMKNKHGVWWEDKSDKDHKRFFSVLNKHYPNFKTTQWNHE